MAAGRSRRRPVKTSCLPMSRDSNFPAIPSRGESWESESGRVSAAAASGIVTPAARTAKGPASTTPGSPTQLRGSQAALEAQQG